MTDRPKVVRLSHFLVPGVATTILGRSLEVELEIDLARALDPHNPRVLLQRCWEGLEFWPSVGSTVVAAGRGVIVADPQMGSGNKVGLTTSGEIFVAT